MWLSDKDQLLIIGCKAHCCYLRLTRSVYTFRVYIYEITSQTHPWRGAIWWFLWTAMLH